MADAVLSVEAKIHDEITNALKSIQGEMRRLEHTSYESFQKMERHVAALDRKTNGSSDAIVSHMKKMGAAVVAAAGSYLAFNKISGVLSESIEAAREQTLADQDLRASLQSTGHAAGVTFEELTKMASGLQSVTNFQDDAIQKAQGMLLTFTKIGKEVFPQATEMTLNLAQKFKTDATQAAVQLGKALNDPIQGLTALRRVGIQYSATQEAQIRSFMEQNNILGAQGVIMKELETQFGGLARATQDPLIKFKNAMGDVKEEIGFAVLPALQGLADKVLEVVQNARDSGDMEKFLDMLTKMAGVATGAAEAVLGLADAVVTFNKFIAESPVGDDAIEKQQRFYDQRLEAITGINIQAAKAAENVGLLLAKQAQAEEKAKGFGMPGMGQGASSKPKGMSDAQKKAIEEEAKFQEQANTNNLKREVDFQNRVRKAAEKEQKEAAKAAVEADEKKTEQIYKAREQLAAARAGTDEMALLQAKQEAELDSVAGNERAITDLKAAHLLQRDLLADEIAEKDKKRENDLTDAKIAAGARFANAMVGLIKVLGEENREAARAAAIIAQFSAIASTAAGVMKAYEQGGVLGFFTGAAIAAEGVAQVATIQAQVSKFATGTLNAPGGLAMVGERGPEMVELPRGSRVFNNSETRQMTERGGGTQIDVGGINITLTGSATPADGQMVGDAVLRTLARNLKEIEYRGIRG